MNNEFRVLSIVAMLLKGLGWLIFVVGLYIALYSGIYQGAIVQAQGHQIITNETEIRMTILIGLGTALLGLIAVAFGEIVGVLFAIEQNTRK